MSLINPKSNPLQLYKGSGKQIQGIRFLDRVPKELWMEVCNIVQEAVLKTQEKEMQKGKMVV